MKKLNNISHGYEDISVELIDYRKDIAEHAWNMYRMTWKTLQNIKYDVDNKYVQAALNDIIKFRALPIPREHALMTFRINNISRVCMAQITRQRKAGFNVESQMPQRVEHNVIIPLNIDGGKFSDRARKLIEDSQKLYNDMMDDGIPAQDARYMLIHGQTTSLTYVCDINTFVGSFGFRCENNLSDEINLVYRLCKKAILDQVEEDFKLGLIDKLTYRFYKEIITPADASGANRKVGQNYDKVFGNSFKRYPDANEEITEITENCTYDFTKSAWYLELQKLNQALLFDGEKEMIDSWND
jgi:hypothetical protein